MLNSKRLEISPKNGWRANDFISQLAEARGFEPLMPIKAYSLSKRAH